MDTTIWTVWDWSMEVEDWEDVENMSPTQVEAERRMWAEQDPTNMTRAEMARWSAVMAASDEANAWD